MATHPKKNKNVQIPLSLFNDIRELLDYYYECNCNWDFVVSDLTSSVRSRLCYKENSLALRKDYSAIIYAKDEDQRDFARLEYLKKKHYYKS